MGLKKYKLTVILLALIASPWCRSSIIAFLISAAIAFQAIDKVCTAEWHQLVLSGKLHRSKEAIEWAWSLCGHKTTPVTSSLLSHLVGRIC
jgi:hypothetical protein